jgi:hypothetical protein
VSNLKEENTLLKQEKETLNHRIVEQAKEMTGKVCVLSTQQTTNFKPKLSKFDIMFSVTVMLRAEISFKSVGYHLYIHKQEFQIL